MEQDEVQIKGYVTIWQGEGKNKKSIIKRAENHFVDAGLKGLVSALVCNYLKGYGMRSWSDTPQIYIGSDTVTTTTHEASALITPIGTVPGTAPNSINGATRTNPSSGVWRTSYTAMWYAGAVSGTVGELGLYLRPFTDFAVNWVKDIPSQSYTFASLMVSRLSSADTDFSSFVIDPSKSLTVQWDVEVSFA
jgi:hypothetical protein